MSNSIDRRVVEMQFDNARFESNAQETMTTLDKLKQSLKFTEGTKGFENVTQAAKAMDLSPMEKAILSVQDRLSGFGIVGATIIQNLTNKAMELAGNLVHAINAPLSQIKSGGLSRALNLEQAKFMIDGLGVSWEKVYKNVDKAVSGTRFGLDEAAKVASQLVASGVSGIGDMNGELQQTLDAIADVASMANRSYSDVGDIFATVASNGKLMTMQLRQFSASGLNVAAALAKEMGKTESEINEMVTKGQISFAEFAEAMSKAYGGMSKKANDTFSGALSNVKAALSRIGAEFYIPGIEFARNIFVELIPLLNGVKASLKPVSNLFTIVTKSFSDLGGITEFFNIFKTGAKSISTIFKAISESFGEVFGVFAGIEKSQFVSEIKKFKKEVDSSNNALYKMKEILKGIGITDKIIKLIKGFNSFLVAIRPTEKQLELFKAVLTNVFSVFKNVGSAVSTLLSALSPLHFVFKALAQTFGTLLYAGSTLAYMFTDYIGSLMKYLGLADKFKRIVAGFSVEAVTRLKEFRNAIIEWTDSFKIESIKNWWNIVKVIPDTISRFTKLLKPTDKTMNDMKDTLMGVVSILSLLKKGIESIFKNINADGSILSTILRFIQSLIGLFFSITGAIGRFFIELDKTGKATETFTKFISVLKSILSGALGIFQMFIGYLTNGINAISGSGAEKLDSFAKSFDKDFSGIGKAADIAYKAFYKLGEIIDTFIKGVGGAFANGAFDRFLTLFATGGIVGAIGVGVEKLVRTFRKFTSITMSDMIKLNPISQLATTLDALKGTLFEYQKTLKADQLKKIATAILILAAAVLVMSLIDPVKMAASTAAIGYLFTTLMGSLETMQLTGGPKMAVTAASIQLLAGSLLILAIAMKVLASISWEDTAKGLISIGVLLKLLSGFMDTLSKGSKNTKKGAATLIALGIALNIMALALKQLGSLSVEELAKGLISIGILLGALSGFLENANLSKNGKRGGVTIVLIAASLIILAKAVKMFGEIDTVTLIKGLGSILAALLILSGFAQSLSGFKGSLVSMGVMMIAVAAGLIIMSKALENMGNLSLDQIGRALVALGGSLLILSIALHAMKGTLLGSAALLIASVALIALSSAIKVLGSMSLADIGKALLALAGAFVVLGVSALGFTVLAPAFLIMAAVLLAVGAGFLMAGKGMVLFAAGLAALSGANLAALSTLSLFAKALGKFIILVATTILEGIKQLIPKVLSAVLELIIGILTTLRDNVGQIITLIFDTLNKALEAIAEKIPEFVVAAFEVALAFIESFASYLMENEDRVTDAISNLVLAILKILWGSIKKLALAAWEMIKGIKDKFNEKYPEAAKVLKKLPRKALKYLKEKIEDFKEKGKEFIKKIKDGIDEKVEEVYDFFKNLPSLLVEKIKQGWEDFKAAGSDLISGLLAGIKGRDSDLETAGANAAKKVNKGFTGAEQVQSPSRVWYKFGGYLGEGLVLGIKSMSGPISKAGETTAMIVNTAINKAMDIIDDPNFTPKITPVVDLSNVYKSAGEMNGIFGNGLAINPGTSLNLTGNLTGVRPGSSFMLDSTDSLAKTQQAMAETIKQFIDNGMIDPRMIYDAVREGASMATISMNLNDRELSRGLRGMGVVFR